MCIRLLVEPYYDISAEGEKPDGQKWYGIGKNDLLIGIAAFVSRLFGGLAMPLSFCYCYDMVTAICIRNIHETNNFSFGGYRHSHRYRVYGIHFFRRRRSGGSITGKCWIGCFKCRFAHTVEKTRHVKLQSALSSNG